MIDYIKTEIGPDDLAVVTYPPNHPFARAARRLAMDPSSGWTALPPTVDGEARFTAPAKVLAPRGARKPRPDAASHLEAYRAKKAAQAAPSKPSPTPQDPAPRTLPRITKDESGRTLYEVDYDF